MASTVLFTQAVKTLRTNDSFSQAFTVPAGTRTVLATFTNGGGWPAGTLAHAKLSWSNGESTECDVVNGGNTFPVKIAQGVPQGITDGVLDFTVFQPFASAITIEALS